MTTDRKKITIFIADDHEMILPGIRMMVENEPGYTVVGMATDGGEACKAIKSLQPDIAVLDLSIPTLSGFEVISRLRKDGCSTRFIVLTSYSEDSYIKEALSLNVDSYILKENSSTQLLAALHAVSKGLKYMAPKVLTRMMQGFNAEAPGPHVALDSLTPRELELIRLVAEARSGRDISAALGISEITMKGHKAGIMRKLGLHSSAEILLYARRNNLVMEYRLGWHPQLVAGTTVQGLAAREG